MPSRTNNWWIVLGLLLLMAGALALRLPQLDARPLHNDESVNAIKIQELWDDGKYAYNPDEFHGPTLYYATLPFLWIAGIHHTDSLPDALLRMAPVTAGVVLILLLLGLKDGMGGRAMLVAGLLTAISPSMVFYSRYFIHEMLLVCFTMLQIVAGWRYYKTRSYIWPVVGGASMGLMYATKETFVLPAAAMLFAVVATFVWNRRQERKKIDISLLFASWNTRHHLVALGIVCLLSLVFFTSFFTNWSGPLDSIKSYMPWLKRAGGASPHIHPWYFYFERLAWFHPKRSPVWSELLIFGLSAIGIFAALRRQGHEKTFLGGRPGAGKEQGAEVGGQESARENQSLLTSAATVEIGADGSVSLARFLVFFTVSLCGMYSAISYKTPWCALGFWHGMILLSGIGAMALLNVCRKRWMKLSVGVLLLAAAGQLCFQAWRASFNISFADDSQHPLVLLNIVPPGYSASFVADSRNPYVYAQTVPDILKLVERVEGITKANPDGLRTVIKVIAPDGDYLPLPWYLRRFKQVGWYEKMPDDPYAPLMIVGARFGAELDEKSEKKWLMVGLFQMRPGVFFELYVQFDLWKKYIESLPRPKD